MALVQLCGTIYNLSLSKAPVQVSFNIARSVLIALTRHLPLRFYFTCGFLRVVLNKLTGEQLQFLLPGSIECYRNGMRELRAGVAKVSDQTAMQKYSERIVTLPDNFSAIMWLGDPSSAKKVVLFFHGGGYKVPMSPGHLEWCLQAYIHANPDVEVAVALLQYSLAPEAAYPMQLSQAASALMYLLKSGFAPKDIIIGGDSAGGNLTAQLLGHLLHPHPKVDAVQVDAPLLGAFLVSPFLSARTNYGSFIENNGLDMISAYSASLTVVDVLEGTDYENEHKCGRGWATPADVDESWLDSSSRICRKVYVTTGQQEVLRDQGILFAEMLRRHNPDVEVRLEIVGNEAHDFILLEGSSKIVGDATIRMRLWFNSLLC